MDLNEAAEIEAFTEYLRASSGKSSNQRTSSAKNQSVIATWLYNSSVRFGLSIGVFAASIVLFNNHEWLIGSDL